MSGDSRPNETERRRIRTALVDRYGQPKMIDAKLALSVLEIKNVRPQDIAAFSYSSHEAAEAFAAANLEYFGHPTLATEVVDSAVIGVIDLRPAIARLERRDS